MELVRDKKSNHANLRPISRLRAATTQIHVCADCGKVCPTKQQVAIHAFKEHGRRPALRSRLSGVHCKACLMIYSNGPMLHNHCSNRSKQCGEWYMAYMPEVDPKILATELEADRIFKAANMSKGRARFKVLRPAGQLVGPLPPGAPDRKPFRPYRQFT